MRALASALLGAALLLAAPETRAQSKTGTSIGNFLLIEPSARAAAMGNAGVTLSGEVLSAYYNPGAIGHMEKSDAQFTHSTWLADVQYNFAGAAVRVSDANTILLSVTALNSGEMDVRTVEQPEGTGERFSVSDLALGVGFSRRVTDRFSAGIQANYIQESIWHSTLRTASVNFGVLYRLPFRAYLGASISNFGLRGRFDGRDLNVRYDDDPDRNGDNSSLPAALITERHALPILFRVGLGFPIEFDGNNRAQLVVNAFQPSDNTNSVSVGGEYTFMNVFSARAGYQNAFQQDLEGGPTLGAGVRYDLSSLGVRFDYGWADHGRLDAAHRFTLGVSF